MQLHEIQSKLVCFFFSSNQKIIIIVVVVVVVVNNMSWSFDRKTMYPISKQLHNSDNNTFNPIADDLQKSIQRVYSCHVEIALGKLTNGAELLNGSYFTQIFSTKSVATLKTIDVKAWKGDDKPRRVAWLLRMPPNRSNKTHHVYVFCGFVDGVVYDTMYETQIKICNLSSPTNLTEDKRYFEGVVIGEEKLNDGGCDENPIMQDGIASAMYFYGSDTLCIGDNPTAYSGLYKRELLNVKWCVALMIKKALNCVVSQSEWISDIKTAPQNITLDVYITHEIYSTNTVLNFFILFGTFFTCVELGNGGLSTTTAAGNKKRKHSTHCIDKVVNYIISQTHAYNVCIGVIQGMSKEKALKEANNAMRLQSNHGSECIKQLSSVALEYRQIVNTTTTTTTKSGTLSKNSFTHFIEYCSKNTKILSSLYELILANENTFSLHENVFQTLCETYDSLLYQVNK
jgi:hypothetical protein